MTEMWKKWMNERDIERDRADKAEAQRDALLAARSEWEELVADRDTLSEQVAVLETVPKVAGCVAEVLTSLANMHWYACEYYWSERKMWNNPRKHDEGYQTWMQEFHNDIETAGSLMVKLNVPPKYIVLGAGCQEVE